MAVLAVVISIGVFFFFVTVIGIVIYIIRQWNVPVVILRYQGDKRRPMILITRGRKSTQNGVSRLFVRGYKTPLRDFKSENYYPFKKGKNGALILWEPKPGTLTPTLPKRRYFRDSKRHKQYREMLSRCNEFGAFLNLRPVKFDYDEDLYSELLLNAVDDTDVDFMLQEYARIDSQYTTGWRDFLAKYGGHMVLVIVTISLLAGFIVWLDKSPEWAAQCAGAARETTTNILKDFASQGSTPPG